MTLPRMPWKLALLGLAACAFAEETKRPAGDDPYAGLPPKRAALERMLSERESDESFELTVAEARKQGIHEQAILEARFLYLVDRRDDAKLAGMLPLFLERRDKFRLADSEIFAVQEDWLAVVEYVQAIAALRRDDRDAFKKHITEAFWLSPRQGSAFAPHIDRLRLDDAMRQVKLDPSIQLESLLAADPVQIGAITKDRKALLLHFWSPWSRECEASMPDFKVVAAELAKNEIAVASLIAETTPEVLGDAKEMIAALGSPPPGLWLRDREKVSLHRTFRVQSVPTMVLISPDGRVLFNGHPSEDRLWEALSGVAPDIARPSLGAE